MCGLIGRVGLLLLFGLFVLNDVLGGRRARGGKGWGKTYWSLGCMGFSLGVVTEGGSSTKIRPPPKTTNLIIMNFGSFFFVVSIII